MTIQIQGSGSIASNQGGEATVIRLEVDMNTVPESISELGGENAAKIFAELVEAGTEIAASGATA